MPRSSSLFVNLTLTAAVAATTQVTAQQWVQQQTAPHPAASWFLPLAYDELNSEAVLFGGFASTWFGDTWLYANGS